jgi:hypothetical protein
MKKSLLMASCFLVGGIAMAQNQNEATVLQKRTIDMVDAEVIASNRAKQTTVSVDRPEVTLWSEDFANGIPSTWTNQGFDEFMTPNAQIRWEYRGPSTTPSNAVGSRGAYGSAFALASATTANGFVVFDSDWMDNAGTPGNFGNGVAAAPHIGYLTSPVINLTGEPNVSLNFQQYYRRFAGPGGVQSVPATYVEFSNNGGTTWGNRVTLNTGIAVNAASPNGQVVELDLSAYIGNSANARVRFIFDGDYYIWMLDDISITDIPANALKFTGWRGAPAKDMIFRNLTGDNVRTGHMTVKQCRNVFFDANIYNFGLQTQTNVRLEIDVLDASGAVVFNTSSADTTLARGDTASFNVLVTSTPWNACTLGEYRVVYKTRSAAIPTTSGSIMETDTFIVRVTDSIMAQNFGDQILNTIGTNTNFGLDGVAFAPRFDLTNDDRAFGSWAWLSTASRPGGLINVYVYDTTGFDLINGFPTQPKVFVTKTLTSADTAARFVRFDFTDQNGVPLYLNNGGYYVVYEFFSSNNTNHVFIGNNATFPQPNFGSVFYFTRPGETPRWYTGFNNSTVFVNPIIRMFTCPASAAATCMSLSLEDVNIEESISVYPNPTSGILNLRFDTHNFKRYDVKLVNMNGQVVFNSEFGAAAQAVETLDFTSMATGLYMLNVTSNDGKVNTYKVNIQ